MKLKKKKTVQRERERETSEVASKQSPERQEQALRRFEGGGQCGGSQPLS